MSEPHIPRRCADESGLGDYIECSCGWLEITGPSWAEHLPDSLDAAWAEAEAALPEGWQIDGIARIYAGPQDKPIGWRVTVIGGTAGHAEVTGPTPAAALRKPRGEGSVASSTQSGT